MKHRLRAVVALAILVSSVLLAVPASARQHNSATRLAAGVTVWRARLTSAGRPERLVLMRIDLSRAGLSVNAASPREVLGAARADIAAQANASHALGGINGDFFSWDTDGAVPRGALIRSGVVLKTPRPGWRANFYVRKNGTAGIGKIPFLGRATRNARHGSRASSLRIYSINTLGDALRGRLTLLTPQLLGTHLRRACVVANGRYGKHARVVTSVRRGVRRLARLNSGHWSLVSCRGRGERWLRTEVRRGDHLTVSKTFKDGRLAAAVSGGRVLVRHGHRFITKQGRIDGRNPLTFACVSRSGTSVVLGVVDGRSNASAGLTQLQLQMYLISLKCWSAMTFDGGGSTTLVARFPGHSRVTVMNVPSDGDLRPVVDGVFVYKR